MSNLDADGELEMNLTYLRQMMDLAHLEHLLERFPKPSHQDCQVERSDEGGWRLVVAADSTTTANSDADAPHIVADAIPDRATADYLVHAFTEWPATVAQLARLHAVLAAALDGGDDAVKQQIREAYADVTSNHVGDPDANVSPPEKLADETSDQGWVDGLGM